MRQRFVNLRAAALDCVLLGALTAWMILPLFRLGYVDRWISIESTYIGDARFLAEHWPRPRWQPLWHGGTRFDYFCPPLLRYAVALPVHFSATDWCWRRNGMISEQPGRRFDRLATRAGRGRCGGERPAVARDVSQLRASGKIRGQAAGTVRQSRGRLTVCRGGFRESEGWWTAQVKGFGRDTDPPDLRAYDTVVEEASPAQTGFGQAEGP